LNIKKLLKKLGFLLTGIRADPDYFTYAVATLVAKAGSKLSLAKLSFAFTFFERILQKQSAVSQPSKSITFSECRKLITPKLIKNGGGAGNRPQVHNGYYEMFLLL